MVLLIGLASASAARWQQSAPVDILDGVPVSIKDLILTRGWPTLRGSRTIDPTETSMNMTSRGLVASADGNKAKSSPDATAGGAV